MTNQDPSRVDRLEAVVATHNNILSQLATSHQQLVDFATRQAERQQETLDRHDTALSRIEASIEALSAQQERTDRSLQALSQTQAETLRLIADNSREIQRIWQHLERRFDGNGNGRNDQ